jgi:cytochrome c553
MKIALAVSLTLLLLGCSEEQHKETKQELSTSMDKITKVVKEESVKMAQNTQETLTKTVKSINKEVTQKSQKLIAETSEAIDNSLKDTKEASADGAKIFTKCTACHGQNAEKKALNKSQIIKGWSEEKIVTALDGYKTGTYGGSMKGVMKPQASKLNDSEVKAVAKYISNL